MTIRTTCLSAFAGAVLMSAMPIGAQANVEAGSLVCHSEGAVSFVVGSTLNLHCVFKSVAGGPEHHYSGVIRRYGVDLGVTKDVTLGWAVLAPTGAVHPGDLAGTYGGVQGSASIGVGGGANALVGGSGNTFALQPVSAQGQMGINLSAGVSGLELHPADLPHHHRHHHKS